MPSHAVPDPMAEQFLSFSVANSQAVERAGYAKPSPIQMAAIPLGMQQRDVIGIAGWHGGCLSEEGCPTTLPLCYRA